MVAERRREREVRPRHDESSRCESDVKGCRARALPKTCPFPRRVAGAGHFDDQTRSARRRAILRKAVETWTPTWLSRRRRRARGRLRWIAQRLRQLDQLFAPGIRERRRLEHHRRLRLRRRRASDDCERERARHCRASFCAGGRSVQFDRKDSTKTQGRSERKGPQTGGGYS